MQELLDYFVHEYGLILTESEVDDILNLVKELTAHELDFEEDEKNA